MNAFLHQPITVEMVLAVAVGYFGAIAVRAFVEKFLLAIARSVDDAEHMKRQRRAMDSWRADYHREFVASKWPSTMVNQTEIRDN